LSVECRQQRANNPHHNSKEQQEVQPDNREQDEERSQEECHIMEARVEHHLHQNEKIVGVPEHATDQELANQKDCGAADDADDDVELGEQEDAEEEIMEEENAEREDAEEEHIEQANTEQQNAEQPNANEEHNDNVQIVDTTVSGLQENSIGLLERFPQEVRT
jgi:hypothetical protein